MEITPEKITELKENEIFVFGSNYRGVHGAGAAKLAMNKFGAEPGVGVGPTGQCYALPTKDVEISTLSLDQIRHGIEMLDRHIRAHPDKIFLITKIGCGLAGYTPKDIAPLFRYIAINCRNITLPIEFWREIDPYNTLAWELKNICIKNNWGCDWEKGGVYLHLEVSEFIEALRGKKGNATDEAADVLFVLMSILSNYNININDVFTKLLTLRKTL